MSAPAFTVQCAIGFVVDQWPAEAERSPAIAYQTALGLIKPAAPQSIGLAFHELANNSLEHGALAAGGVVNLAWQVEPSGELRVIWNETHGQRTQPTLRGFGHVVLERLTPQALEGRATLLLEAGATAWTLTCPVEAVTV